MDLFYRRATGWVQKNWPIRHEYTSCRNFNIGFDSSSLGTM
jgi:hypothetical protein